MNVSLWIANRLRLRGRGGSGAGPVIAVAGVALAVMILEFTLAVSAGFKDGIRERLSGFDAQLTVLSVDNNPVEFTPALERVISETFPGADVRESIRRPALLKTADAFEGIVFIAQSADGGDFGFERGNIVEGSWPDYSDSLSVNDIVVSSHTASALGLKPGDKVDGTFFVNDAVKLRRYTVAGIYRSNFGEYDRTVAYASLPTIRGVEGLTDRESARIDIRGLDMECLDDEARQLQQAIVDASVAGRLDRFYTVDSIRRSGAVYFNWLDLLDTNVTVIFILMLCVAGLTLVSSLFILILERVSLIGTLRAIGATKIMVRRIFIDMAMRLAGLGIVIGNLAGIGLLLIQKHTHLLPLDPEMYYLSSVPVVIHPWAFVALNIGVAVTAWLVLVFPAGMASRVDPAKTMNYQ